MRFLLGMSVVSRDSDPMQRTIDHLPEGKRRELAFVVDLVRGGFATAVADRRAPRLRDGRILKIMLFGSYARDDWVEDPVGRYFSDYDLLVVVDHEDLTDVPELWLDTEKHLLEALSAGRNLRTPVSLIIHSLDDVNEKLRLGRYFFIDVVRDGVVLFAEPGHPFDKPVPLSPADALRETQDYFDEWYESADEFFDDFRSNLEKGRLKKSAFELHQAVERFYHCLFLVRTLYSPKTHNLNRLRTLSEDLEPHLKAVWSNSTKFEKRCYELLRAAYVKARYSRQYRITAEELNWLGERAGRSEVSYALPVKSGSRSLPKLPEVFSDTSGRDAFSRVIWPWPTMSHRAAD